MSYAQEKSFPESHMSDARNFMQTKQIPENYVPLKIL